MTLPQPPRSPRPARHRWLTGAAAWLLALGLLVFGGAAGGAQLPTEYELKAAFLLNFARFIDWPAQSFTNAAAPLVFGVVGDDPFGDGLPALVAKERIREHPIEIRHVRSASELAACHLLFVAHSEEGRTGEILQAVGSRPVVTVAEGEDFLAEGGVIRLALVRQKIRFDINVKAANRAGLRLSSKLLQLARELKE